MLTKYYILKYSTLNSFHSKKKKKKKRRKKERKKKEKKEKKEERKKKLTSQKTQWQNIQRLNTNL